MNGSSPPDKGERDSITARLQGWPTGPLSSEASAKSGQGRGLDPGNAAIEPFAKVADGPHRAGQPQAGAGQGARPGDAAIRRGYGALKRDCRRPTAILARSEASRWASGRLGDAAALPEDARYPLTAS